MKATIKISLGYHSAIGRTACWRFGGKNCLFNTCPSITFKSIRPILFSILPFLFFATSSLAQTWLEAKTDSLIQQGIRLSIHHDYAQAEQIFQQLIENHPDHPVGYFFMAATIQSKMMDYESDRWSEDFQRYVRLAIDAAEKKATTSQEHDLWSLFYHGSALCYLAFYEGRNGDYLKAVSHGLSGISILKKIINIDPTFHDAYFGIGSYQYWRSQKTRLINWLPLVSDDRAEGMLKVRQAIRQGKYTQYAAMNELIWILLDAGQADEAYAWTLQGLDQFPQSRFFLWGAAKSAFASENYPAAATHFQQLLASIINSPTDNDYNEYLCRLKLAQCYEKLGQLAEASQQIAAIEALPLSTELQGKLKKQRGELFQLKSRLASLAPTASPGDSSVAKHQFADKQRGQ